MRRAAPIPQDRLMFVEGLRGAAALFVVLSHFRSMVVPGSLSAKTNHLAPWLSALLSPLDLSHLAVAAFIVLSGFCLQVSLFNGKNGRIKDLKQFFKRRAWRILPAYYACLAFSILVAIMVTSHQQGMPFTQYVPVTWRNVWQHVFLIHNFSPDVMYKINGVLWSISLEVQLYVLFPVLVAGLFRIGRIGLLASTLGLALLVMALFPDSAKLYPWFLPLFALGMVAGHFAYRPNLRVAVVPWLGTFVFWVGVGLLAWAVRTRQGLALEDGAVGLAVAAMVYVGSVAPHKWLPRVFAWKPLAAVGGFSYSLYLMHHPIEQILYVYRPGFVEGPAKALAYLLVVGLPVILGLCYWFSLYFERPFIRARKVATTTDRDASGIPVSLPLRGSDSADVAGYVLPRRRYRHAVIHVSPSSEMSDVPVHPARPYPA